MDRESILTGAGVAQEYRQVFSHASVRVNLLYLVNGLIEKNASVSIFVLYLFNFVNRELLTISLMLTVFVDYSLY